ncbi:MAG: PD40 domain-containing protein [Acidobacteria bacterium]|nr:PD40 domain-containing protein [Acidobacteriota bacterium]
MRVKQLASSSVVQLIAPTEDKFEHLTFSPDGNWLLYGAVPKGEVIVTLWQVPTLGGAPRKMLDDVDSGVSFSADGKRFVFVRPSGYAESSVLVLNADGAGEPVAVARTKDGCYLSPQWSPDGRQIALALMEKSNPLSRLVGFMDASGGPFKPAGRAAWAAIENLVWAPDGSGVYASAKPALEEPRQLWFISALNGEVRQLTGDLSDYNGVSVSGDGEAILSTKGTRSANLWKVSLSGSADQSVKSAVQITSGTAVVEHPSLSPDDERIAYSSFEDGRQSIWKIAAAGGAPVQVTTSRSMTPNWSPDGKSILCWLLPETLPFALSLELFPSMEEPRSRPSKCPIPKRSGGDLTAMLSPMPSLKAARPDS